MGGKPEMVTTKEGIYNMLNLENVLSPLIDGLKYTGVEYPTIAINDRVKLALGLEELETALGLPIDGLFRARWAGEKFYFAKPGVWGIDGKPMLLFGFKDGSPTVAELNPAGYLIKAEFGHTYQVTPELILPVWIQSEVQMSAAVTPVASLPNCLSTLGTGNGSGKILPRLIDTLMSVDTQLVGPDGFTFEVTELPTEVPGSKFPRMRVAGTISYGGNEDASIWQVPGRLGERMMIEYLMDNMTHTIAILQSKKGPYVDIVQN